MNAKRGPRPSQAAEVDRDVEEPAEQEEPKKQQQKPTFAEVYWRGRATVLGTLNPKRLKRLTSLAREFDDPLAFIDAQAAAMEETLEAGGEMPDFPVSGTGVPKARAVCETNPKHTDVRIWRVQPNNRKDCVCNVCGKEWVI